MLSRQAFAVVKAAVDRPQPPVHIAWERPAKSKSDEKPETLDEGKREPNHDGASISDV